MTRLVLAWRYVILAAVAVALYFHMRAAVHGLAGGDWYLFVLGADRLTMPSALHAFSLMPDIQTGPLALAVTVPLRHLGGENGWIGTSAVLFALALVIVRCCELAGARLVAWRPLWLETTVLVGGILLLVDWTQPAGRFGHPDDPLALLAIAVAVGACVEDRWVLAAVAVGLAAAFKPWGFYLLPLAAVADPRRYRGLIVAALVGVGPWLPFLIADHGTLDLSRFQLGVGPASTLRIFGIAIGTKLSWIRGVQLVAASAIGAVAIWRRCWVLIPLAAFAVRINLEVQTWSYYGAGVMVGALVADLLRPMRVPALRTAVAFSLVQGIPWIATNIGQRWSTPVDIVDIAARLLLLALVIAELSGLGERLLSRGAPAVAEAA
ncbi:MAG: hypothetical protein ACTHK4_01170 [Mycobacteriales bacterium]